MDENVRRVLVADAVAAEDLQPLVEAGFQVDDRSGISSDELMEVLPDYEALIVRSRTQVTEDLMARCSKLRVVGRAGTGVDNVDVDAATRAGVLVMNVPGGNARAAAEHTIALMMALVRRIPQAAASLKSGAWDRKSFKGSELKGKTLAVIGLGRIGREVAACGRGLGMTVVGFDPQLSEKAALDLGIRLLPLDKALSTGDVVTLHVPLTDQTNHLIDDDRIAGMKRGVRILNVARGGIVDEAALLRGLESGQVKGVALDVFEVEPPTGSALIAHESVVATPHLGASTAEAQSAVARGIARQVAAYLTDGTIMHAVNLPSGATSSPEMTPWCQLARCLGGIGVGLCDGGPDAVQLRVVGEVPYGASEALMREVLVGMMAPFTDEPLNVINAPLRASERGLTHTIRKRASHPAFQSLLRVKIVEGDRQIVLSGTLFGNHSLRIVRAFGCNMDAIPEGPMLWVKQQDRPGLIAHLGAVLGNAGINIGNMSVGRSGDEDEALAVLNLDREPDEEVMNRIKDHPHIRWARCVPERMAPHAT